MNHQQLDRALCEKLGIAPITRTCTCGHDLDEHVVTDMKALNECYGDADIFRPCLCEEFVQQSADYPPLSTSEAGGRRWFRGATMLAAFETMLKEEAAETEACG